MSVNEKALADTITGLSNAFREELYAKKQDELEDYWFFEWDDSKPVEWNFYEFHDMLKLYGSQCRKWEEQG